MIETTLFDVSLHLKVVFLLFSFIYPNRLNIFKKMDIIWLHDNALKSSMMIKKIKREKEEV